jgi:hypothetical protein
MDSWGISIMTCTSDLGSHSSVPRTAYKRLVIISVISLSVQNYLGQLSM